MVPTKTIASPRLSPPGSGKPSEQAHHIDEQYLHERHLPRMQDKAKADEDTQDVDHEEEQPILHLRSFSSWAPLVMPVPMAGPNRRARRNRLIFTTWQVVKEAGRMCWATAPLKGSSTTQGYTSRNARNQHTSVMRQARRNIGISSRRASFPASKLGEGAIPRCQGVPRHQVPLEVALLIPDFLPHTAGEEGNEDGKPRGEGKDHESFHRLVLFIRQGMLERLGDGPAQIIGGQQQERIEVHPLVHRLGVGDRGEEALGRGIGASWCLDREAARWRETAPGQRHPRTAHQGSW